MSLIRYLDHGCQFLYQASVGGVATRTRVKLLSIALKLFIISGACKSVSDQFEEPSNLNSQVRQGDRHIYVYSFTSKQPQQAALMGLTHYSKILGQTVK